MNYQKLTQKSLEALQNARSLAEEHGNQQLTESHMLLALLRQTDGLIPEILRGMNVSLADTDSEISKQIERLPKIANLDPSRIYLSSEMNNVFTEAEKQADKMKDEYVSVEHLMLAMIRKPEKPLKEMFERLGITESAWLDALKKVRGNQRVTSDDPEGTYDVLKKYGSDLVELARQQKLDPVIGWDDEIRRVIRILSRKTKNNPCLIG